MIKLELYNQDCLTTLKHIQDGTIDCIITDPPYKTTKYGNTSFGGMFKKEETKQGKVTKYNYMEFDDYFDEFYRVMKDGSYLFIFCNFMNLRELLDIANKNNFKEVRYFIWDRPTKIASKYGMYNGEMIIVFRKGKDKIMNNCGLCTIIKTPRFKKLKKPYSKDNLCDVEKPVELVEKFVLSATNENDLILDPFMGIGAVGIACKKWKRNFIGVELDTEYFDIAKSRIENTLEKKISKSKFLF